MGREILFRGKRKDNGEWIEGGCAEHDGKTFIITWARYMPDTRDWDTVEYYENNPHYNSSLIEVDHETVCQYIGLTDKNGRKIFENDIVSVWSERSRATLTVKQRMDGLWILFPSWKKQKKFGLCPNGKGETTVEVIGNIFDNPELLKQ